MTHIGALRVTRTRNDSLSFTMTHIGALRVTRTRNDSLSVTMTHIGALRVTWTCVGVTSSIFRCRPTAAGGR